MKSQGQISAVIFDLSKVYSKYLAEELERNKILITDSTENELEVFEILKKQKPDLLIYDLFGSCRAFETIINEIRKASPDTKIVVFSFEDDKEIVDFCIGKGVKGFFYKANFDYELIIKSLKRINNGETIILTSQKAA